VSQTASSFQPRPQSNDILAPPKKRRAAESLSDSVTRRIDQLSIDDANPQKIIKDLETLNLGAVPKKRPPPLNIQLVESVILERRQRQDDVNLPQLVESTMPPTRDTSVFHFPEKLEAVSESGVRLRNAKELSDILIEIKERNSDDLSALDNIDSLLSRSFGVVS
jgi:hypothetical protein